MSTKCQATQGEHVDHDPKSSHLSITQLIIRRGLTVFAAVGLLAVGVGVYFLVPLPETIPANSTMDWINSTDTPDQIFTSVLVTLER